VEVVEAARSSASAAVELDRLKMTVYVLAERAVLAARVELAAWAAGFAFAVGKPEVPAYTRSPEIVPYGSAERSR
jgi:hypothetical protein